MRSRREPAPAEPAPARLLVRHLRKEGARLSHRPEGAEDAVGSGYALLPAQVPARAITETTVEERTSTRVEADWFDPSADVAVQEYLSDPRAATATRDALRALWSVRDLIVEQRREQQRLIQVREALSADVEQGRATLEVLLRSNDADLKVRTRQRLATAQAQHTRATELLLRVQSTLEEKEAELQRGLRTLRVPALPRAD